MKTNNLKRIGLMLENGVISYDELEAMLSYDDTVYEGNYQVSEELNILEENPKGLDDFLDDYPIKGSKKNKKDFADYEDDDFDWELWFKSQ